jgi:hypothetical protein
MAGVRLGDRGAGGHHGNDGNGNDGKSLELHDISSYFSDMKYVCVTRIGIGDPGLRSWRSSQQWGPGASGWAPSVHDTLKGSSYASMAS